MIAEVGLPRDTRLLRLATYASSATALVLVVAKLASWLATDSVSLLASLIDSCMDALASLILLFAVRYALRPADEDHRFGHGKAESLAGLGQSLFVLMSGCFLVYRALDRLVHPAPLENTTIGVAVMVFAIVATLALLTLQSYVIQQTGSIAIKADALHYKTDLLTNVGVLAALGANALFGARRADPFVALTIGAYILYSAWDIGQEAVQLLMDRELPEGERRRIAALAQQHAEVRGVHDLRTRRSGRSIFIQLHLEMDGRLSLRQAHAVADEVRDNIEAVYQNAEVIIHQDPVSVPR
jgi:ferrous-iron efflux pump FieF